MSNGVRYTPTFALPSEYEQQAMEARRRRRMAEMLAQQAYQPQDVGVAPIPSAAPLVQGLQAFLAARQERKAEEAEEKAKKAGQKEFADYIRSFEPEERTVGVGDVAAMEAAMPQLDETGRLTHIAQSAVAAPNQRLMPAMTPTGEMDFSQPMQMQVGGPLNMAQRRARALEGFESTNPMVQQYAAMQFEKSSPKALALELEKIDPTKVDMASVAEAQRTGDISKIRRRAEPVTRTGSDDYGSFIRTYFSDGTYEDTRKGVAPSGPKDERLVSIIGPDGKAIFVKESEAVGKTPFTPKTYEQQRDEERQRLKDSQAVINTNTALENLADLVTHPGRKAATGKSYFLGDVPGTDAKDFSAKLETFKAQTFVPMVEALKGMGALSDAEGKRLTDSVGALDRSMTEEGFEKELRRVANYLYSKAVENGLNVTMPEIFAPQSSRSNW